MKTQSKVDKEYFKSFITKYPTWNIFRLDDGTLKMIPPIRETLPEKDRKPWKT